MDQMRKAVGHAWLTYQHAKYGVLARILPKLIREAQAADTAYAGTDHTRDAAQLLGQVYQIASSMLRKLGEHELSWLAADRSIAVSQRAGDQLLAGCATYRVAFALLALGRARPALEVNVNIANRLAPGSGRRDDHARTPVGLRHAAAAGRDGGRADRRLVDRTRPDRRRRGRGALGRRGRQPLLDIVRSDQRAAAPGGGRRRARRGPGRRGHPRLARPGRRSPRCCRSGGRTTSSTSPAA